MIGASAQNSSGTTTNTQTATPERGGLPLTERHIKWAEDVVDNEGQGRKSSKVCCIYHKPRPAGESSSESESSDSDFDDDSDDDGGSGRSDKAHSHKGSGCSDHQKRKPRPNAYERIPKNKK
ncbi:type 1 phosphatase regulator YPI1 [Trichophyton tonsurans CBS 112818]|uniref:Type 1 phosphatases regulator n=1 Tax=Trichophyton tonsurans (strain CBS 112818) TaxID=647933 RepID=F2S5C3_TRIT1|nr:type 1 phosphatase regulator YPI1 [Trichophyton tonsurans CBS 112818]